MRPRNSDRVWDAARLSRVFGVTQDENEQLMSALSPQDYGNTIYFLGDSMMRLKMWGCSTRDIMIAAQLLPPDIAQWKQLSEILKVSTDVSYAVLAVKAGLDAATVKALPVESQGREYLESLIAIRSL